MTSSRLPVIISMEGGVASHPCHCVIVICRWQLGAPLDPEKVGQLDLGTFSSSPGPPPGVLPAECGSHSSEKVEEASPFILGEALPVVP